MGVKTEDLISIAGKHGYIFVRTYDEGGETWYSFRCQYDGLGIVFSGTTKKYGEIVISSLTVLTLWSSHKNTDEAARQFEARLRDNVNFERLLLDFQEKYRCRTDYFENDNGFYIGAIWSPRKDKVKAAEDVDRYLSAANNAIGILVVQLMLLTHLTNGIDVDAFLRSKNVRDSYYLALARGEY